MANDQIRSRIYSQAGEPALSTCNRGSIFTTPVELDNDNIRSGTGCIDAGFNPLICCLGYALVRAAYIIETQNADPGVGCGEIYRAGNTCGQNGGRFQITKSIFQTSRTKICCV